MVCQDQGSEIQWKPAWAKQRPGIPWKDELEVTSPYLSFYSVWVKLDTVELLNMQVRNKVYWEIYILSRVLRQYLSRFQNVFDLTVFVNLWHMHFQNNLHALYDYA